VLFELTLGHALVRQQVDVHEGPLDLGTATGSCKLLLLDKVRVREERLIRCCAQPHEEPFTQGHDEVIHPGDYVEIVLGHRVGCGVETEDVPVVNVFGI